MWLWMMNWNPGLATAGPIWKNSMFTNRQPAS